MMLLYINLHWFRNTFSREEPQAQNIKLSNFKFATILQEEPDTGNVRPSRSNSMADEWVLSFYWVNYVFLLSLQLISCFILCNHGLIWSG